MNGSTLTLGFAGVLTLAGLASRRGSLSVDPEPIRLDITDETWVLGELYSTAQAALASLDERVGRTSVPHGLVGPTFLLHDLVVDEGERGRGWGRRIVRNLEADLRARGVRTVVLHASDYSGRTSRGFWTRLGYAPLRGEEAEDDPCMYRVLS